MEYYQAMTEYLLASLTLPAAILLIRSSLVLFIFYI